MCNYDGNCQNGLCKKHGGQYICQHRDNNGKRCHKLARKTGGYCQRHGGNFAICQHEDNGKRCDKQAKKGGHCIRHGGKYSTCRHEDNGQRCDKNAQRGGYCIRHGGKVAKCQHVEDGIRCDKNARKGGFCLRHGGKTTKCQHKDDNGQQCDKNNQGQGYCKRHAKARAIIGGDVDKKFLSQTNGEDSHQQEPQTKRPKVINIFSGGAGPSTAAVATPNDTTPGSTTAGSARYSTRSGRTPNDTGAASGMPTLPHSELRGRQRGVQRGTVRPPALTDNTIDWAQVNQAEVPDNGYSLIEFNFDGKEMMSDGTTGVIMLKGSNDIDCIVGAIKMTSPADIHTELKVGKLFLN